MARGPLDFIPRWWPVGLAVAAAVAGSAASNANTSDLAKKVDHIDAVGTTHEQTERVGIEGRLARIEANQETEKVTLSRIEGHLR